MKNQSNEKQIKKAKEKSDIISERDEIKRLLSSGCWKELSNYLQKINAKYIAETLIYNLANPNPPATLEENAHNCIKFLDALLAAKETDNSK